MIFSSNNLATQNDMATQKLAAQKAYEQQAAYTNVLGGQGNVYATPPPTPSLMEDAARVVRTLEHIMENLMYVRARVFGASPAGQAGECKDRPTLPIQASLAAAQNLADAALQDIEQMLAQL